MEIPARSFRLCSLNAAVEEWNGAGRLLKKTSSRQRFAKNWKQVWNNGMTIVRRGRQERSSRMGHDGGEGPSTLVACRAPVFFSVTTVF